MTQLNELGFYTLAGAPQSPRELLDEVRRGRGASGSARRSSPSGSTSRRRSTLSGAVGAVLARRSASPPPPPTTTPATRWSPPRTPRRCTGSPAAGSRSGSAAASTPLFDAYGIPTITTAQIEDFAGLMRRLWQGEVIFGHDGPAGQFPILHLDATFDEDIPLGLVAFGPNSLALAGRGVRHGRAAHVLHRRDGRAVRCGRCATAAEQAGRDPAAVRIWSCYATVGDHLPEDLRLKKTVGPPGHLPPGLRRPAGARPTAGTRPCSSAFRADEVVSTVPGRDRQQGRHRRRSSTSPRCSPTSGSSRRPPAAPSSAPRAVLRQFDLGVDGVIMHGATPDRARADRRRRTATIRPAAALRRLAREPRPRPRRRGSFRLTAQPV